jgi:hypothetical protein
LPFIARRNDSNNLEAPSRLAPHLTRHDQPVNKLTIFNSFLAYIQIVHLERYIRLSDFQWAVVSEA